MTNKTNVDNGVTTRDLGLFDAEHGFIPAKPDNPCKNPVSPLAELYAAQDARREGAVQYPKKEKKQ